MGIVHAVSGSWPTWAATSATASSSATSPPSASSCARTSPSSARAEQLRAAFEPLAERFGMDWSLHDSAVLPRVLIMVSQQDHCLNDLLYRHRIGALPGQLVAIVSNHRTCEAMADAAGIPFHYLPVTAEPKAEQEAKLLALGRRAGHRPGACWPATCRSSRPTCAGRWTDDDQHPPLVPARLQGRASVSPGLRPGVKLSAPPRTTSPPTWTRARSSSRRSPRRSQRDAREARRYRPRSRIGRPGPRRHVASRTPHHPQQAKTVVFR